MGASSELLLQVFVAFLVRSVEMENGDCVTAERNTPSSGPPISLPAEWKQAWPSPSGFQVTQISEVTLRLMSPSSGSWHQAGFSGKAVLGLLSHGFQNCYWGLCDWEFVFSADPRGHDCFSFTKCRALLDGNR